MGGILATLFVIFIYNSRSYTVAVNYLSYKFNDTEEFINTFDEAPLWSAAFGLLFVETPGVEKRSYCMDVGSGAGFPLMELAGRLGNTSTCYGLDTWKNATGQGQKKNKELRTG